MNKKVVSIIILALIVIIGSFLVWKNSREKINTEQKNNDERAKDQKQIQDQKAIELTWYQIPEMEIRFKVDNMVANELINKYIPDKRGKYGKVLFSSSGLSKIYGCGIDSSPLGMLIKLEGKPSDYKDKDYYISRKPKQFNDFFIIYNGPQAVCALKDNTESWKRYFEEHPEFQGWIEGVFDTMEILPQ